MRKALASFVLTLTLAAPAYSAGVPSIHIDNFGQVSASYYRGAQPKGDDYSELAALGVKTIVNLTSDDARADEAALAARAGLKYVQIPMNTRVAPTAAQVQMFLQTVNDAANQPVYVHCVGGRHRTGVMTAVYRMADEGWTSEQAFHEMKAYKFGADVFHPEFKKFVYAYQPAPSPARVPAVVATAIDAPSTGSAAAR
jgi:uncharacterized protein (TIGR01244 family)